MFRLSLSYFNGRNSARSKTPDVGRLLYGKRRNAVHKTSQAKPTAVAVLSAVPNEQLAAAVLHAINMKELGREDVLSLLRSNRSFRRLDRSQIIVDALREADFSLTPYHYSLLMAHANDQQDTAKALSYWGAAVKEGKVNEKLHGALLATYRNSGDWKKATAHCEKMWEDKLVVDPYALHAVLNACRRYGPWEAGLSVFSQAVNKGTKPNAVVYLELLRQIQSSKLPSRSKYASAILEALDGKADVTAGHYNAVMATMSGSNWQRGVALFHEMREKNVQPSRDTLNTLLLLNPGNISHCIRCVAEAHALGMPVTDTMYRAVLSNLFRLQLDHEASQFAEKEYRRDLDNVGNGLSTTLMLSMAIVDSLLAHPRPHDAVVFFQSFESKLGSTVGASTRGLGTTGLALQRWLVQGRVAVVDHNVLLSTRMESLSFHYDSILIPFSSVRLLVRRARELGGAKQGVYIRHTLNRLQLLLGKEEWGMMRVLPFSHQLLAHQYIVGGPSNAEDLKLLREEAEKVKAIPASRGDALLSSLSADEPDTVMSIRSAGGEVLPASAARNQRARRREEKTSPVAAAAPFIRESDRINSAERVIAVAAMLKALNPDADLHVLSTNDTQLNLVDKWNSSRPPGEALTAVHYPDELHIKAPPEGNVVTPSPAEAGASEHRRRDERAHHKDKYMNPL